MDKDVLQGFLDEGQSLEEIGRRLGRHPSTVSYWLRKHGLTAAHRERHASRGEIAKETLVNFLREGATIQEMGDALHVSKTTIRHWMAKYGLESERAQRIKQTRAALARGQEVVRLHCPTHGMTDYWLEGRGYYRCLKCRWERVTRRRRSLKQILVAEAGGGCQVCGYDRCVGALHFHHLDPAEKRFTIAHRGVTRSLEGARHEAQKCALLCANCHAEVEAGVRQLGYSDGAAAASAVAQNGPG
jgi:transposase